MRFKRMKIRHFDHVVLFTGSSYSAPWKWCCENLDSEDWTLEHQCSLRMFFKFRHSAVAMQFKILFSEDT